MSGSDVDPELEEVVEDWALNALVVLFYLPVALGSLLYLEVTGGSFALWVRTLGEAPLRDVALGLGAGLGLAAIDGVLLARTAPGRAMAVTLGASFRYPSVPACLLIATASAVGEELLFRAVLQPRLGIFAAAALFAAAHLPWARSLWPWPLHALLTGLLFGALFDRTGAALAPAVAHGVSSALTLWWIGRRRSA